MLPVLLTQLQSSARQALECICFAVRSVCPTLLEDSKLSFACSPRRRSHGIFLNSSVTLHNCPQSKISCRKPYFQLVEGLVFKPPLSMLRALCSHPLWQWLSGLFCASKSGGVQIPHPLLPFSSTRLIHLMCYVLKWAASCCSSCFCHFPHRILWWRQDWPKRQIFLPQLPKGWKYRCEWHLSASFCKWSSHH